MTLRMVEVFLMLLGLGYVGIFVVMGWMYWKAGK